MRQFLFIIIFFIASPAKVTLAQDSDIHTLRSNLNKYYTDHFAIMFYNNHYKENDIILKGEITLKIENESYTLNNISKEYYNSLNSLKYNDKCKLLYAIESIKEENQQLFNQISFDKQLLYLPVVISRLKPNFKSEGYAFGIWGLKYIPAIRYGIYADSCYDERLDIKKSSRAAISYLKDLHLNFKTFDYTITAFAKDASTTSFFHTNHPDFELISEILDPNNTFYKFLGLCKWIEDNPTPTNTMSKYEITSQHDTIEIKNLVHFKQISEVLNIDYDSLRQLNPLYINDIINGESHNKKLILPYGYAEEYSHLRDSIHKYKDSTFFANLYVFNKSLDKKNSSNQKENTKKPLVQANKEYKEIRYRIVSGDNLGSIAKRYGVKISEIQEWNALKNINIYAGQELKIWVKEISNQKVNKTNTQKKRAEFNDKGYKAVDTYIVKRKDSPYSIAKNYPWASPEDIMKWNNIDNPSKLQVGQELKIFKKKE